MTDSTVRIVGLDVSFTSTGVARLEQTGGGWRHQLWPIRTGPHRKGDPWALLDRMEYIRGECAIATECADLVVVEGPSFSSAGSASKDLMGLWWLVVHRLRQAQLDVAVVPPASLKRWATGKGNADKAAVGVAVGRMWPEVELGGNDVVDALGLASMGAQLLGLGVPWPVTKYRDLAGVCRPERTEAA